MPRKQIYTPLLTASDHNLWIQLVEVMELEVEVEAMVGEVVVAEDIIW